MYNYPNQGFPYPYPVSDSDQTHGQHAQAIAWIQGGPLAPNLQGYVTFTDVPYGTEVLVEVSGLPPFRPRSSGRQPIGPHGFHIHDGTTCEIGDPRDPFKRAGEHWNPTNQPHGNHASDFPVLFSNDGYARMSFFTNRFQVRDIIGKTIIIHQNPDDYRTEPAGNSGKRLACGIIQPWQT
ncbi:superoxide dismutase family protein [Brevibacillus borstelensis]|uniref:superoxide dismutase family protein n=1 Tax=Brevibacillus borstelensis TaxID=45462 RepID=UPI0030BFB0BE